MVQLCPKSFLLIFILDLSFSYSKSYAVSCNIQIDLLHRNTVGLSHFVGKPSKISTCGVFMCFRKSGMHLFLVSFYKEFTFVFFYLIPSGDSFLFHLCNTFPMDQNLTDNKLRLSRGCPINQKPLLFAQCLGPLLH